MFNFISSKSRSRNHSHEFPPVVAPSSTHSPFFVTCLEYGDGGVSMKILRYFVISPLVYNTLWVSVSESVCVFVSVRACLKTVFFGREDEVLGVN